VDDHSSLGVEQDRTLVQRIKAWLNANRAILAGVPFGLLYGALARLAFNGSLLGEHFATMSLAFLLVVPLAVGVLTVWFSTGEARLAWRTALFLPWLAVGIGGLLVGVFVVEALICVVMALPILFLMSSLGGLLACALLRRRAGHGQNTLLSILLVTPFLVAPLEAQFAIATTTATVETAVVIQADAATVWANLVEVPPIARDERSFSPVFDLFGAPKPLAATLDQGGVGGVRRGLFEDQLAFIETITVWAPGQEIAWAIQADTSQVTKAPWQEIGGRYFDVTAARYRIESRGPNEVLLQLGSTHRLSTRLNRYGLLWTRWGLAEFQRQVLQIIKARSEAATAVARAGQGE
jgi:hypothetical protein